jgi:hypothetical protein
MESTVMSRCRLVSLVRLVVLAVVVTAPACKANEGTNATADAGHSSAEASLKPIARTTDGAIAIGNLDAVVAGQEKRVAAAPGDATLRAGLVELLLTRGQYIGSIADYERA